MKKTIIAILAIVLAIGIFAVAYSVEEHTVITHYSAGKITEITKGCLFGETRSNLTYYIYGCNEVPNEIWAYADELMEVSGYDDFKLFSYSASNIKADGTVAEVSFLYGLNDVEGQATVTVNY